MSTPDTERTEFVFDPEVAASRKHLRWILSALMLTMLLAALDQTIVSTALPVIVSDLGGLNQLSWVVTAYLLASTASTPIWRRRCPRCSPNWRVRAMPACCTVACGTMAMPWSISTARFTVSMLSNSITV